MSLASMDGNDLARAFSTVSNPAEVRSTVILGAGIIGLSTAYYLCLAGNTRPDTIHLVEAADEMFASASGRAAGFLAKDCKSISKSSHHREMCRNSNLSQGLVNLQPP